ncbi:hypothetical protein ACWCQK_27095 [Streptomyces sp. NPDC002306]
MGVFARLLGKSKATKETTGQATGEAGRASAATEEQADAVAAVSEVTVAESAAVATGSERDRDASEVTKEVVDAVEADGGDEVAAADGVEIPKQQSAEEAADSEVGESARR